MWFRVAVLHFVSSVFMRINFYLCVFVICLGSLVQAQELRVLTYNIHHGRGADGRVDLERIATVIKSAKPDLVALNEVDRGVNRSGKMDQPAELVRLTGLHAAFEKNIDYDGGEYGNAVLSRFPLNNIENLPLPSQYRGEQRGMLVVEVHPHEGQQLWFAATHFDYRPDPTERVKSVAMIEKLLAGRFEGRKMILAGDLNAVPDSDVVRTLSKKWLVAESGDTFPAENPTKRIDYVLARPAEEWRVVSAEVLEAPDQSDHRPVLVTLELLP
ncbi:endonuclease/exonuclease/phosphatase family protein [Aeoliella sp. SH292]|uniref:endonuclease/exonuclease/phosphatase family protein n=1 Tax=Aeoliella sp. SH292 TaxID=3454464 RepID=UPI003F95AB6F